MKRESRKSKKSSKQKQPGHKGPGIAVVETVDLTFANLALSDNATPANSKFLTVSSATTPYTSTNASQTTLDTHPLQSASHSDANTDSDTDVDDEPLPVEVRSTPDRGLAVFATRRLKPGMLLLRETPLISLPQELESSPTHVEAAFAALPRASQKAYLRLFDAQKSRMSRVASIYYSNCYNVDGFAQGHGGSALGTLASRINHGCVPNVQFSYKDGDMRFYAVREIKRGGELLSNYDKGVFDRGAARQRRQTMYYGFLCRCEACEPKTEFWARSDERRGQMGEIVTGTKALEKKWVAHVGAEQQQQQQQRHEMVAQEALDLLVKLEGLLVKEALMGMPLANLYRSLAKWAERKGDPEEQRLWLEKGRRTCITAFGRASARVKEIEAKLTDLKGGSGSTVLVAH